MVFACPRARTYGVRSEVELYSLCQRGVSESCAAKLSFHQTMFLLSIGKLRSSRQAGRLHCQIDDGLKSISVKYMRQLPGPTANISFLSDK